MSSIYTDSVRRNPNAARADTPSGSPNQRSLSKRRATTREGASRLHESATRSRLSQRSSDVQPPARSTSSDTHSAGCWRRSLQRSDRISSRMCCCWPPQSTIMRATSRAAILMAGTCRANMSRSCKGTRLVRTSFARQPSCTECWTTMARALRRGAFSDGRGSRRSTGFISSTASITRSSLGCRPRPGPMTEPETFRRFDN